MGKRDYTKEAHKRGQKDAAAKKYNPPYDSAVYEFIDRGDAAEKVRKGYKDGYKNGRNQRKN